MGVYSLRAREPQKKHLTDRIDATTVVCPSYHFRPLCGDLIKNKMEKLLTDLEKGKITFEE